MDSEIDKDSLNKLRDRYKIHPLLFTRSVQHSKTILELFETLEALKSMDYPIFWDSGWKITDLYLKDDLEEILR